MDLRGKGKQPGESWDQYCNRVDRELYSAGQEDQRIPLPSTLAIYLLILLVCGFTAWVVLS